MRNPSYLAISRHRVYYLRWPLPQALHPKLLPSTIKVSLRTRDPKLALRLARHLSHAAEDLLVNATSDGVTYGEMRSLLTKHFKELLAQTKARIDDQGRLSRLDIESLRNTAAIAHQDVTSGSALFSGTDAHSLQRVIAHFSLPIAAGTSGYTMFQAELKRSHRDYCEAVIAYDRSLDSYDFVGERSGASHQTSAAIVTQGMALIELTSAYTAEKLVTRSWSKKTESERRAHFALLQEIIDADTDVRTFTAAHAKLVKDTLFKYPKNRQKNERTRGRSLEAALLVAGVDTLNAKTVNKYLQTYKDLFHWAKQNGHSDANWFEGVAVRLKRHAATGERKPFTVEQIEIMVRVLLANERETATRSHRKWGPLIAIYTGARLGEIAQIHLSDIREFEGVPCFDLNDEGEDKHLKTIASRRLVPVHQRLIECGLLDRVEELRRAEETKLFPELTYDASNGWGRALGRWFNERFLPNLGFKTKDLVFHSFRHTMITQLSQAGVEEAIVKAVVGHAQEGVTQQHYFKQGYKLSQLSEALHRLPF